MENNNVSSEREHLNPTIRLPQVLHAKESVGSHMSVHVTE